MPFTSPDLHLALHDVRRFRLLQPVTYDGGSETWTVPEGFLTDLASVPQVLQWLIDDHGTYTLGAVLHDYLCAEARAGRFSRRDADGVFRRVLRELEVPWLQRWMMWAAVRIGGAFSGGMSPREALQFAGMMVPGALVGLLTIPPLVGRLLFRLATGRARARPPALPD